MDRVKLLDALKDASCDELAYAVRATAFLRAATARERYTILAYRAGNECERFTKEMAEISGRLMKIAREMHTLSDENQTPILQSGEWSTVENRGTSAG